MSRRRRPGYLLDVARSSAALLRAVSPNRRAVTDPVDDVQCPRCDRWGKPRRFSVLCHACDRYIHAVGTGAASGRGWSR
ncbi:MAG TPA: hypothetical protein VFM55_04080 [Micromonosporaceae bacterium]|nr:hypothetical protein [Micromonosporaceae bacterium]